MESDTRTFAIVRRGIEENQKPTRERSQPSRPLAAPEDTASGRSVLVVDDNLYYLPLIRTLLEWDGYDVRTAADAEAALQVLKTFRPRLILMDIELPGMNGLELTRLLKASPKTHGITIVAFTGWDTPEVEQNALSAGCDGYIAKPIDTPVLLRRVAAYLAAPVNT
jgi:CheY-like chemotaxis protein